MFQRFKNRLSEVSEEVKKDPRFQNSLASVEKTLNSVIKAENPPSALPEEEKEDSISFSDLVDYSEDASMNNNFFSLTEEDDPLPGSVAGSGAAGVNLRGSRRSSQNSQDQPLFPIYEAPQQMYSLPPNDLDSTAGSEWESDFDRPGSASSTHLKAISKEQLFTMLQKNRARYHKYKGRYADVAKAYTELESENVKVKNVMQQTQDKALRRISELKEQCSLEQQAKRHLEEELRGDLEEKEHIIKALQTKVVLLKSGGTNVIEENVETEEDSDNNVIKKDSEKVAVLEDKVRRLEALLTKCKESIKANKQKTNALTEVKDSLSSQLSEKEAELGRTTLAFSKVKEELEALQKREQEEELQIAQTKLQMHQEIITKDEEIGKLRKSLKESGEENSNLKEEIDSLKQNQEEREKSLETEKEKRISELKEEHDKNLSSLREEMKADHDKEKSRELLLKDEEVHAKLVEREEEMKLSFEEMELRISALTKSDESRSKLLKDLELKIQEANGEKKILCEQLEETRSKLKEKESLIERNSNDLSVQVSKLQEEVASLLNKEKDLESSLNAAKGEKEELRSELSDKTKELKIANIAVESLKSEKARLENAIKESEQLSKDFLDAKAAIESLEAEKERLQKTVEMSNDDLATQVSKMNNEIGSFSSKEKEWESVLKGTKEELEKVVKELAVSESKIKSKTEEIDLEKAEIERLSKELKILESEKINLEKTVEMSNSDFAAQVSKLNEEISLHSANEKVLQASLKETKVKLADSEEKFRELQSEFSSKAEELKIASVEVESLKSENAKVENAIKENGDLCKDLQLAKVTIESLELEKKNLEKTVEMSNSDLANQVSKLNEEIASFSSKEKELKSSLSEVKEELEKATLNNMELKEMVPKMESKLSKLKAEKDQLEEREKSMKDLEEQMIRYEKKLQEQLKAAEVKEETLRKELEEAQELVQKMEAETLEMKESHLNQVSHIKADYELKIRNEREVKETSFKELQVHSIEYQKRLQEQIQELQEEKLVMAKDHENLELQVEGLKLKINEYEDGRRELQEQIEELSEDKIEVEKLEGEQFETMRKELYETQQMLEAKNAECEEINEMAENLRKDLTMSHEDKGNQLVEFEESLDQLERQLNEYKLKNDTLQEQLEKSQQTQNEMTKEKIEVEKVEREMDARISQLEEEHRKTIQTMMEDHEEMAFEMKQKADKQKQQDREEYQKHMEELNEELKRKTSMIEEILKQHNMELQAKQEEMDQEVYNCKQLYTAKVEEIKDEEKRKRRKSSSANSLGHGWDVEDFEEFEEGEEHGQSWNEQRSAITEGQEDFQRTPRHEPKKAEEEEQPARISVSESNHVELKMPSYKLEEATEFEYLKNILYEYMMGKESMTLAKVLTTVVKFSPEQTASIIAHEERKQTGLSGLLSS